MGTQTEQNTKSQQVCHFVLIIFLSTSMHSCFLEDVKGKIAEAVPTKPKNAFKWQKADVVDFIKSLGFPNEATTFAEQV